MNIITKKMNLPDGREITIQTGKLAKQSDGAVEIRIGDTVLLATAVAAKNAKPGVDFMPLTIDYREKYAAAGKFPGGFFKREARPSEYEILTMRLVDRALRPLFPEDFHADTQVMIQLLSADENMADSLACFAASAALACSDIPFETPVSEVRISRVDGEFVINPTYEQNAKADMDMVIAGTKDSIMMVEGEMKEISEAEMVDAIKTAHVVIKEQCAIMAEFMKELGKETKREYSHETHDEAVEAKIKAFAVSKCEDVARAGHADKELRAQLFGAIKEEYIASLSEEELEAEGPFISGYFKNAQKAGIRNVVLNEKKRLDGRKTDEIRPIWSEVAYLPSCHGSAVFTRGETQSLTTLTLGGKKDEQRFDGAVEEKTQNFTLHYNFPPFSTGEARPLRGTSRREVGHGNLAQRALKQVIPTDPDVNPYTIRLVSEILESNGSSSMASVCAGSLALMDGGIKITNPVSGIAMGLIMNEEGTYSVLSDILGDEDHIGDMDFKVTGTKNGITACQMDIKVKGLPYTVLAEALEQAKAGRAHILGEMMKTISTPNNEYKQHTPRIKSLIIPADKIGAIIGSGGKVIQELQAETNSEISIDENPDGETATVSVLTNDGDGMALALEKIDLIVNPPQIEVGMTYTGAVKSIKEFGCFVEVVPGQDGLIHISELAWDKTDKVEDVVSVGDMVTFKVTGFDPKKRKHKLSRKILMDRPERAEKKEA
ncbi:MAG: polyribonucleotide nucleotidyltransferase [Flavobacteriales bacterium]|mgnify:FL=1|jgi:polyribonucleotide nucleotidyltransferase|tara:strand:- start:4034 stop:6184 length:2151 start_codon:yes stop_codon:yes gene_type:complete